MPPQGQSVAADATVQAFLALDDDTKRSTLGKLSDPAKQALLAGIKKSSALANVKSPTEFEKERKLPTNATEWVDRGMMGAARTVYGAAKSASQLVPPDPSALMERAAGTVQDEAAREAAGRSKGYRVMATGAQALGIADPTTMEHAADVGDYAGIVGSAATSAVPLLLGGTETGRGILESGAERLRSGAEELRAPGRYAGGKENIFKGSVPGSKGDIALREHVDTAANDLAEMQRQKPLGGAGGFLRPDMRPRNLANNIDNYLSKMYQNERAAKVKRWGQAQITLQSGDLLTTQDTAKWLARTLPRGTAEQVAARLAKDPKAAITLAESDELARAVNSEMRKYGKMSPQEQAAARMTSRRTEGLQDLDRDLSNSMGNELNRRGETGMKDYERRYAALSRLRDGARKQMNEAEAFNFIDRINIRINPKSWMNVSERIASPRSGPLFQKGLKKLAKSGAEPEIAPPAGPVTNLPPPPNRMLPAIGETGRGMSDPSAGTRAPGGPTTKLPAVPVGESGGARSEYRSGVSQAVEEPGKLAKGAGPHRTPEGSVIKGGTATPDVRVRSNQPASSIPLADTWSGMRTKIQGIIDDSMASAADKAAARNHIRLLDRTTRTGPAEPQMEPHLADQVRSGKLTHGEIFRMERTGVIPKGSASRIFKLARGGGLRPPPAPEQ